MVSDKWRLCTDKWLWVCNKWGDEKIVEPSLNHFSFYTGIFTLFPINHLFPSLKINLVLHMLCHIKLGLWPINESKKFVWGKYRASKSRNIRLSYQWDYAALVYELKQDKCNKIFKTHTSVFFMYLRFILKNSMYPFWVSAWFSPP